MDDGDQFLLRIFDEMRVKEGERRYFAMTLTGTPDGKATWTTQTHWAGWRDGDRRIELRAPSEVDANWMTHHWRESGQPYWFVYRPLHMYVWVMFLGGNALVDTGIAQDYDPELVAPSPSVRTGELGFDALSSLPDAVLRRAPDPKHRMRILNRDGRQCRICGRRPDTNTDIELDVHHIRPWASGGVTHDENLVTLCHTCHSGLDPHEDRSLFALAKSECADAVFQSAVERYRAIMYEQRVRIAARAGGGQASSPAASKMKSRQQNRK